MTKKLLHFKVKYYKKTARIIIVFLIKKLNIYDT